MTTNVTPEQFAARVKFLVRLGRGLHVNGMASHQIEDALEFASATLGIQSQFFSLGCLGHAGIRVISHLAPGGP